MSCKFIRLWYYCQGIMRFSFSQYICHILANLSSPSPPALCDLTCQEAELWDEESGAWGRGSSRSPLLHPADEQHLVPIYDVQIVLLSGRREMAQQLEGEKGDEEEEERDGATVGGRERRREEVRGERKKM